MKEWLYSLKKKLYLLDDKLEKKETELWHLYCETSRHGDFRTYAIKQEVLDKIQNKRFKLMDFHEKIKNIIQWIEVKKFFKELEN